MTRSINLLDPDTHSGDPWPLYTWLREEAPLYWDEQSELWCVSRYDDIVAVARDPETFTSTEGNVPKMPSDGSFINLDGRAHTQRRGLVKHLFTSKAVAKLEDHIRDATTALIDRVIADGSCDFVDHIAAPLPVQIIAEMTGVPAEWHGPLREWIDVFMHGGNGPSYVTEEVNEAFINFGGLHMMLVDERIAEPQDDLLSMWVQAEFDGRKLDEHELLFEHTMFIIGGSETARNAISGGVYMLAQRPEQRRYLLEHPEAIPGAVEEAIRWVTPFIRMSRTATRDVQMRGKTIKAGDEIIMLYPAANRDPRKFDDPDRFDVRRAFHSKSLSFGYGAHYCIGAFLARAEMRIMLEEMLRRMPDWEVAREPTWVRSCFMRGLKKLPLRFSPGAPLRTGG